MLKSARRIKEPFIHSFIHFFCLFPSISHMDIRKNGKRIDYFPCVIKQKIKEQGKKCPRFSILQYILKYLVFLMQLFSTHREMSK